MHIRIICLLLIVMLQSCSKTVPNKETVLQMDWQFSELGTEIWYPARVPGSVQEDLIANQLIPDPFIGNNEDSILWVEEKDWIYKANLRITAQQLTYDHIEMIFQGLDTYATILVNNKPILITENMFRQYKVDVKDFVVEGDNSLEIRFESPVNHNRALIDSLPYKLPTDSENSVYQVGPLVRKAAYQFGWDFAPRIVTMGIWQPIELNLWDNYNITDLQFYPIQITDSLATYKAVIEIESDVSATVNIKVNDQLESFRLEQGINAYETKIKVRNPKLWWPNGFGEQNLYDFVVEIEENGQLIDHQKRNVGIRTVQLVHEPDSIGTSYTFLVNGEKIFMKGANWSPLSSYPGSIADSVYENRLLSVKEAHMNMLRVWGGGIYENDIFYDLCDQYGILVWQDFMFANTMYNPDTTFRNNVVEEVKYQVKRLRNHPSIAQWNGNNEIEVAWKNWGWQQKYGYSARDSLKLWGFYKELFKNKIPETLSQIDPDANYTSTSPLSNWGNIENFNHSSMHYWGVWHGNDRFEDFNTNVGRFMAEYGFQSYPSAQASFYYLGESKPTIENTEALHQKSYVGNKLIKQEALRYFNKNVDSNNLSIISQQIQALALKTAIEAHRLTSKCDGTLFWQLNDCWPGPSWSVIDYFGNRKIAYDVVKDRYQNSILIPQLKGNDFKVYLVQDVFNEQDRRFRLELFNANDERLWVTEREIPVITERLITIYRSDRRKLLDGMDPTEVCLKLTLIMGGEICDIEYQYFTTPGKYNGDIDLIGRTN